MGDPSVQGKRVISDRALGPPKRIVCRLVMAGGGQSPVQGQGAVVVDVSEKREKGLPGTQG